MLTAFRRDTLVLGRDSISREWRSAWYLWVASSLLSGRQGGMWLAASFKHPNPRKPRLMPQTMAE